MELVQMPYTTAVKAEQLLREVADALDELAAAQTEEEEAERILEMRFLKYMLLEFFFSSKLDLDPSASSSWESGF